MRIKGSMTVFVALSLLLVISFLMALLEGARAQGLNTCAGLVSDVAIHSVCAEYQPVLWEDYKLLMLDGSYGDGYSGFIYHLEKDLFSLLNWFFEFKTDMYFFTLIHINPIY